MMPETQIHVDRAADARAAWLQSHRPGRQERPGLREQGRQRASQGVAPYRGRHQDHARTAPQLTGLFASLRRRRSHLLFRCRRSERQPNLRSQRTNCAAGRTAWAILRRDYLPGSLFWFDRQRLTISRRRSQLANGWTDNSRRKVLRERPRRFQPQCYPSFRLYFGVMGLPADSARDRYSRGALPWHFSSVSSARSSASRVRCGTNRRRGRSWPTGLALAEAESWGKACRGRTAGGGRRRQCQA